MPENYQVRPPTGYSIEISNRVRDDGHERGAAIIVNNKINYEHVPLNTTLQAVAVRVWLEKWYTVCSIYLPHVPVTKQSVSHLIDQLDPPFLILGDMNAHSPIWGGSTRNDRGQVFEELLLERNISLMNDCLPTHYYLQTGTLSTIDVSICSSDCILDFNYSVINDLHDSDHYPIRLILNSDPISTEKPSRFNTDKADWNLFLQLTETDININSGNSIDEIVTLIVEKILHAAEQSIPKTSNNFKKKPVPWWSDDCKSALIERRRAERALKRHYSIENKIRYNRCRAKCRFTLNLARRLSWKEYISSINQQTNLHQVWKKIQKISGKYSCSPTPLLKENDGTIISSPVEVANKLAK